MSKRGSKTKIAFYIISTKNHSKKNTFKIGIHSGTIEKLISRYTTYFPHPIVYYFQFINDAAIIENKIKYHFYNNRITNHNGGKTEWVIIEYQYLYNYVKKIIVSKSNIIVDKLDNIKPPKKIYKRGRKSCSPKFYNMGVYEQLQYDITVNDLINCNEFKYDFDYLSNKSNLTRDQYIAYKKYLLLQKMDIDEYENNEQFQKNITLFFDNEKFIDRYCVLFCYNVLDDFNLDPDSKKIEKNRIEIITDLVNRLTNNHDVVLMDDDLVDVNISNAQYIKAINDIANNSIYFKNEAENRALFFKKKGKFKELDEKNQIFYSKTVAALLESYNIGLKINKRIKVKGKLEYVYSLSVDQQIRDIIQKNQIKN